MAKTSFSPCLCSRLSLYLYIMAKNLFTRYIWLINTIYRAGKISLEEINEKWLLSDMSEGETIPIRTFHNHRKAIEDIFDINIECERRNGYCYYIENVEDIEKNDIKKWLLNTFAVNNIINENHLLKKRILLENIPSGEKYLIPMIEAMRCNRVVTISYQSFWKKSTKTFDIEPYCLKIFRQRWYVLARSCRQNDLLVFRWIAFLLSI